MFDDLLPMILKNVVVRSPIYLAIFVGIVFAAAHLQAHGKSAVLVLIGLTLLLLGSVASNVFNAMMPNLYRELGSEQASQLSIVVSVLTNILSAGGIGTIVCAALSGRASDDIA
jgi:hypothetical protein